MTSEFVNLHTYNASKQTRYTYVQIKPDYSKNKLNSDVQTQYIRWLQILEFSFDTR